MGVYCFSARRKVKEKVLLQCHQKTLQDMVVCFRQAHQTLFQYRKRPKVTTCKLLPSDVAALGTRHFRE